MCKNPKKEVDLKLTYQGISLGYVHLECMKQVIGFDANSYMRDEDGYTIWSLMKVGVDGRHVKHTEPCLNSFRVEPPEEAVP